MTDFLTHLAGRTLGLSPLIKPKLDPTFAPATGLAAEVSPSLFPDDAPSDTPSIEGPPSVEDAPGAIPPWPEQARLISTPPGENPETLAPTQAPTLSEREGPTLVKAVASPATQIVPKPLVDEATFEPAERPASAATVKATLSPAAQIVPKPLVDEAFFEPVERPASTTTVEEIGPPALGGALSVDSAPAGRPDQLPSATARPGRRPEAGREPPDLARPKSETPTPTLAPQPGSASLLTDPAVSPGIAVPIKKPGEPPTAPVETEKSGRQEIVRGSTRPPAEAGHQPKTSPEPKPAPPALQPGLTTAEASAPIKPAARPGAPLVGASPPPAERLSEKSWGRLSSLLEQPGKAAPHPTFQTVSETPAPPRPQVEPAARPLLAGHVPLPDETPERRPQPEAPVEAPAARPLQPRAGRLQPGWPAATQPPEPAKPPTLQITIGRVEVKAMQPPAPAQPKRPGPVLSLSDYLKQRSGGRR
jgi:hypothetical protein